MNISQQLSLFASSEGENDLPGALGANQTYESNPQQQHDRQMNIAPDQNSNDFMRQMQQQLALQQQTGNHVAPQQALSQAPSTNPGGLGQLNNVLVSMLQQSAQAQPGQNPFQNAENFLAQIIAAANGNNMQTGAHLNAAPQNQQAQQHQAGLFLDQQHGSHMPVNNGMQSMQQQLMSLQHQLGAGFAPTQPSVVQQQPTQPQNQEGQQFSALQQQQQLPFMGQMGHGLNPAMFHNSGAFGSFGPLGGGTADPSLFQNQIQMPNNNVQGFDVLGTTYQQGVFPFQQPQIQHTETLSDGKKSSKAKGATALTSMLEEEQESERLDRAKKTDPKKRKAKTFPEKLMQAMMQSPDDDIVAWLPDGKSFVVVDPDRFCVDVLGKVFKECKYPSFVRKLHRWGFVRLTSGTGTDCFHHPQFIKNKRDLASKITCAVRGERDKELRASTKPPSLAGVEKFIHAKVIAAAASTASGAGESLLLKDDEDLPGGNG